MVIAFALSVARAASGVEALFDFGPSFAKMGAQGERDWRLLFEATLRLYAFPRRIDLAGARFGAAAQVFR